MKGTAMEMKYALLSFGIPADRLPINSNGKLKYELFQQQVEERRKLEAKIRKQLTVNNLVACPTDFDVLLGRGRPFQEFVGNLRLNRMVDMYCPSYTAMTRSEKTETIVMVIGLVHQSGGRFLRRLPTSASVKSTANSTTDTRSTEMNIEHGVDGDDDTKTDTAMDGSTTTDSIMLSSSKNSQPAVATHGTAAGWEIVNDHNIIHRKVNNVFKTRKNHISWSL